jgi:hypothetical protein
MLESSEEAIVRNLIEALERLQEDLDRVELWTSTLGQFHRPVPDYQPDDRHLLPAAKAAGWPPKGRARSSPSR